MMRLSWTSLCNKQTVISAICLALGVYGTEVANSAMPVGYFDKIDSNGVASGWAIDPTAPEQSIEVNFYVDTPLASAPVTRADAEAARPDVNATFHVAGDHGFIAAIPQAFRDGKVHRLYAYAVAVDGKINQLRRSPKPFKLALHANRPKKGDALINRNGIAIATAARFGGAIASLRWNNKEFVDIQDHGREIQTAWQGDNAGECFNPTEAGSAKDGIGLDTTSNVVSLAVTRQSITTVSHPAFWLQPGQAGASCEFDPARSSLWAGGNALNRTAVSSSTLKKK